MDRNLASRLAEVAESEVRSTNILALQTQLSVQRKAALLSSVTLDLVKSHGKLAELCRPLEVRN